MQKGAAMMVLKDMTLDELNREQEKIETADRQYGFNMYRMAMLATIKKIKAEREA